MIAEAPEIRLIANRKRSLKRTATIALAFALLPVVARADAGTPLMLAGAFHLLFLNFFIGLLEAAVTRRVFRSPQPLKSWPIVLANYFSMIVGSVAVPAMWYGLDRASPTIPPLIKAPYLIGLVLALSYLLSMVLEWPFFAFTFRKSYPGWRSSFRASVVAQTASYALLVPFYLLVSPITMLWSASVQHDLSFVRLPIATVFYIDPDSAKVGSIRTDGARPAPVATERPCEQGARLVAERSGVANKCDLFQVGRPDLQGEQGRAVRLMTDVGTGCVADSDQGRNSLREETWWAFGAPADMRPADQRRWTFRAGFWGSDGCQVEYDGRLQYWLAFDTPFDSWPVRSATVLPSNQVVFQLGLGRRSQIILLDMPSRKLAVLAMGQGPAVVLDTSGHRTRVLQRSAISPRVARDREQRPVLIGPAPPFGSEDRSDRSPHTPSL